VGGIRTALFAWLVAKQANGKFILRLEDTDKKREVKGSAEHLKKSLLTLGIDYDEGPDKPGDFGPYKQSDRLDIYKKWAQKLIDSGRAYADPYTPQEVQAFREEAQKTKKPFLYLNNRPENPPEWDGSRPLRFKSDPNFYAHWSKNGPIEDLVMGEIAINPNVVDDFVLVKSDGYPTYNFAHIIDDAEMQITHVIRGQEFVSSMPNYLNLYDALGLDFPKFAHLPHILNEQGNKKLGKRDGAKDVLDYIRDGYLPEAMVSFIATLGWNDGTEQEVFTVDELIKKFSLDRVGKSGAHFDEKRLNWTNGHFIRELPLDELYTLTTRHPALDAGSSNMQIRQSVDDDNGFWPKEANDASEEYKKNVLAITQERLKYLAELPDQTRYFFTDLPIDMELIEKNKQLKKVEKSHLKKLLHLAEKDLAESDFTPEDLQKRLNDLLEQTAEKPAVLFSIIRIATTWAPSSPALNDTLAVLGRESTLRRINKSIQIL
jgi:glutamyl-tRNA synthetase